MLIHILHDEALNVRIQSVILSGGTVLRFRQKYKKTQAVIQKACNQLHNGDISAKRLLNIPMDQLFMCDLVFMMNLLIVLRPLFCALTLG